MYQAIMSAYAGDGPDLIAGDKSPGHLYHVDTILEWFREGKVLHAFRDPRAILASELAKRTRASLGGSKVGLPTIQGLGIMVHVMVTWAMAVRLHRRYASRHPERYHLTRFEDLVRHPERTVRTLSRFLEIPFSEQMLNPPVVDSSFRPDREHGFDRETLTRWRNHLPAWMSTACSVCFGRYLREFGYGHA